MILRRGSRTKSFFIYFGLAVAIQVLLLALGVALRSVAGFIDVVFERFLMLYEPFIFLIWRAGNYTGDAAMIEPVIKGVPLGVLTYALLAGIVGFAVARNKSGGP